MVGVFWYCLEECHRGLKNEELAKLKREHAKPSPGDFYSAECNLVMEEDRALCYAVTTRDVGTKIGKRFL